MKLLPHWIERLALGVFLTGLVLTLGIPIAALIFRAVTQGGADAVTLFDPVTLSIAAVTAKQAVLSTFFSVLLGYPLGLWVGAQRSRWACALLAAPYGVPTLVVSMAIVLWLGRQGVLAQAGVETDWLFSLRAVIGAHVLLNAPLVALWVARAREDAPALNWEAARTLGAGAWSRFVLLLWPETRWALGAAAAQVFSLCVMSFAIVLLLGGGPPVETLETAIFFRVRQAGLDLPAATGAAIWQIALTVTPWLILLTLGRRAPVLSHRDFLGRRAGRPKTSLASLSAVFLAAVFLVPYIVLLKPSALVRIFQPEFIAEWALPLRWSLILAAGSATFALTGALLVMTAAGPERRWVHALASLPAGVSTLVVALGLWLAYSRWVDPYSGSPTAIIVLQGLGFLPLAHRALWPLRSNLRRGPLEVARTLGSGPVRAFFEIEAPRWHAPLLATWGMIMGAALGEVAAVSFFFSEEMVPLPLLLARWMSKYRFEDAESLALLLGLISGGIILGMSWVSQRTDRTQGVSHG